jgi:hypothetical protein
MLKRFLRRPDVDKLRADMFGRYGPWFMNLGYGPTRPNFQQQFSVFMVQAQYSACVRTIVRGHTMG